MGGKHKHKNKKETGLYYDIDLFRCEYLGKGHNGIVYLLPKNKVIKICYVMKDFNSEAYILNKVNGNKYFPRIYETGGNYMIRDYVDGMPLKNYIKKNGLSRDLVLKLLELLKEFETLKFTKIDIRCKDIFVQPDGNLKVIDPQKFYHKKRDFPRHLSKGLYKLGVLGFFLEILKSEEPSLYKKWTPSILEYISQLNTSEEDD